MVIFRGERPERCSECELSNAGRCKFNTPTGAIIDGLWTIIDIDDYPGCKHCVFGDEIPVLKPIVVFKDGTVVGYQDTSLLYSNPKKAPMYEGNVKMAMALSKLGCSAAEIAEAMNIHESIVRSMVKEESNEQKSVFDESKA